MPDEKNKNLNKNSDLMPQEGRPGYYWYTDKDGVVREVSESNIGDYADDDYSALDDTNEDDFGDNEDIDDNLTDDPETPAQEDGAEPPSGKKQGKDDARENSPDESTGDLPGSDPNPGKSFAGSPTDALNAIPTEHMGETGEKIDKAKDLAKDIEDVGELVATEGADLKAWADLALRHKEEIKESAKRQLMMGAAALIVFLLPIIIVILAFMGYGTDTASGLTPSPPGVPNPANVKEYCKYVGGISNKDAMEIYGASESEVVAQLVEIDFPEIGPIRVHRLAAPCFIAAGNQLVSSGALDNYNIVSMGTFSWRCAKNPDMSCKSTMSNHSFGIAADINPATNPYRSGTLVTDFPSSFIQAFKDYGFGWGGDWKSSKDAMHFEWLGRPPTQ